MGGRSKAKATAMDSINSFKGYGKVDAADDREFRRKSRLRLIIIGISAILLLLIVVGAAVGVVLSHRGGDSPDGPPSSSAMADSIKAVCSVTRYPVNCYSSLSAASANATSDPEEIFKLSLRVAMDELSKISSVPDDLVKGLTDKKATEALRVCKEMFEDAVDHLNNSLGSLRPPTAGEKLLTESKVDNLRAWLSAAVTDQETCLDAFEGVAGGLKDRVAAAMRNSTRFTSNSLAIASGILRVLDQLNIPLHRKLLSTTAGTPSWVSGAHRRVLLQAGAGARPIPNVTVATDGTGQVKTIGEAVAMAPKKSPAPFVIYVKEGKYVENVLIDKHRWNVVIYGDGMRKSIVSGSLNFVDGTRTYYTATFGELLISSNT